MKKLTKLFIIFILNIGLLHASSFLNHVSARTSRNCKRAYLIHQLDGQTCYSNLQSSRACVGSGGSLSIMATGLATLTTPSTVWEPYANKSVGAVITKQGSWLSRQLDSVFTTDSAGSMSQPITINTLDPNTKYSWYIQASGGGNFCKGYFSVDDACSSMCVDQIPDADSSDPASEPYEVCDQIPLALSDQWDKCDLCVNGETAGIWTAIGCIPRDPETIVSVFLRFGLGMGGGVALLMILGAGFMMTVSQGDPKQIDTAKQWLTSAIAGLLFIIFSVTILQFIGYSVFQIPGFGG